MATPVAASTVGWRDPAWSRAREHRLVNTDARMPVRHATRVRVLWSDEALWLHYECDAETITATMTRYKDKVWTQGAVEAYIMAPGDESLYEFQVSPRATRRDLRVASPGRPDQSYQDDWVCPGFTARARVRTAAGAGVVGWDALVRIPWSGMAAGADSERWMLGLFRWEHHPEEFSGLKCQPGVDPHDPSFLLPLVLSADPDRGEG